MQTKVCRLADLWIGEMRPLEIRGHEILLVHTAGVVSAFPDRCVHQGVALSRGHLAGCVLTCSAHEWQYDVRTGQGINPDQVALRRYPVEIREGEIWIDVDDQPLTR